MDKVESIKLISEFLNLNGSDFKEVLDTNAELGGALMKLLVEVDKEYGGSRSESELTKLLKPTTQGGGLNFGFIPSILDRTNTNLIFDSENELKKLEISVFYISFYQQILSSSLKGGSFREFYVTPKDMVEFTLKKDIPIINYGVKKQSHKVEVEQMPLNSVFFGIDDGIKLNPKWLNRLQGDEDDLDALRVFVINEGNIWYDFEEDKLYRINKIEIDLTPKGKQVFVIKYFEIGNYRFGATHNKYVVCDYSDNLGTDLFRQVRVTSQFSAETNLYPIAVDDDDFINNIAYELVQKKNKSTPSATPKAPTLSGRPKLLNQLGSNDPDAVRKMVTLPNGYRAEYDTSTTWSEDWVNKGWRPSPQRSASQSKPDAIGYGADGNWYEIKTDKNGTQRWAKMKSTPYDLNILKKYITNMSEEDIALLVDQKRYYLANTDRDEDEEIYEELDKELAQILGFLEDNGYEKYSNS